MNKSIRVALAALPLRQRAGAFLTHCADLTPADAAVALAISERPVRQHLARTRAGERRSLLAC